MNYTLVIYESAEDFAARKSASTGRDSRRDPSSAHFSSIKPAARPRPAATGTACWRSAKWSNSAREKRL